VHLSFSVKGPAHLQKAPAPSRTFILRLPESMGASPALALRAIGICISCQPPNICRRGGCGACTRPVRGPRPSGVPRHVRFRCPAESPPESGQAPLRRSRGNGTACRYQAKEHRNPREHRFPARRREGAMPAANLGLRVGQAQSAGIGALDCGKNSARASMARCPRVHWLRTFRIVRGPISERRACPPRARSNVTK